MQTNSSVRILMVDDRQENLLALEVLLAGENYEFVKAASGKEALKILLHEQDFAIILMDVKMPIMDGLETATLIRESEKFRGIPIIFLTANTDRPEDIFKGYKTGAVDYMVKPLSKEILKAKVSVFAELYRKNKELTKQSEFMKDLNKQLKQQTTYVRSLIEASLDPMIIINTDGIITDMNQAMEIITGMPREKINGTNFVDYFTRPKIAAEAYHDIFEKGFVADYFTLTICHVSGKFTQVLLNGSVYKDDKGNILGAVIEAREKLLSKYSRSLIEASLDPLITINFDGKITDMNEALSLITGITREKITGTDFFDYFTEPQKARVVYEEVFTKGFVINFPLTVKHKQGKLTEVLFSGSVYKDGRGNVEGIVIVARDITAQKVYEKELIEAKRNAERERQNAEKAAMSKQQFLSNMSHEIRTPMNSIIGFTKVALKTDLNDKQRAYLNAIKTSGDTLIVLINDILDLAKVNSGKMTFEQIPFKLSTSISAILLLFEAKLQESGMLLKMEYDETIPDVLVGDPVRLNQIILNLMSNASKFTSTGEIIIAVKLQKAENDQVTLKFSVTDTGIGIPETEIESIFDNFQQASSGTTRLYGGTGLGLAIVKQLVESQGGKIDVKSKVGVGSTFTFMLPFKTTTIKIGVEPEKNEGLTAEIKNAKILVVEDGKLNQFLMRTLLEEAGCQIEIAENGKRAIEKLQKGGFDIILMDLHMPEMNGFHATKYIRENIDPHIPIIALTADVTTVDLEKCKAMGMNDYLSKPVDENLLFKKLNKFLKKEIKINEKEKIATDPQGQKYTNLNYLKELSRNKDEMMAEMIHVYLEETPALIKTMKESINKKDWTTLQRAAHSLAPSFYTIGIKEDYASLVEVLQEQAICLCGGSFSEAVNIEMQKALLELVLRIETVCDHAFGELRKELSLLEKR